MRDMDVARISGSKLKRYTAQQWAEEIFWKWFLPTTMPAEVCGAILHYYRQEFYLYNEMTGVYRRLSLDDIKEKIALYLRLAHYKLWDVEPVTDFNQTLLNNIVLNLQTNTLIYVPSRFEMPCWLLKPGQEPFAGEVLALQNGLLSLDEALAGADDPLHEWTPRWFSLTILPYAYKKDATCPLWIKFLDEVMEADAERIDLLQMWFGYCLTTDCAQHKFLLAVGPGANGKSVLFRIMTELLGRENVSQVPLEHFGDRFALSAMVGKRANIVSEIGPLDRVAEGRLKEFVGADRMLIDRKYKEPVSVKPTARLMLATNSLPRFADKSEGIWRRMLLVPFNVTIPPAKQNPHLADDLMAELPGIFNWSLEGLRKLRERGRFSKPAVSQCALAEYRLDCDPARQFLTEHYEPSSYGAIATRDVYNHYLQWCSANGYQPMNSRNFGKTIKSVFTKVERRQFGSGSNKCRLYSGLQKIGE